MALCDGPSTTDHQSESLGTVNEPSSLRELVRAALQQRGGSGRSLAAAAERAGHKITHTTVNQLAAGTYKFTPSAETIRAVAWLAQVPEKVAFAAAGVPMPGPPFADELPPGVDNLSPRSRRAAVEVLRALVEAEQKAGGEHDQRSAPRTPAGTPPANNVTPLTPPDQGEHVDVTGMAARPGEPDQAGRDTAGEESQADPEDNE